MTMLLGDLFSKACVHRKVYPSIQILRVPFLLHLNCEELNCQVKENSHCTTLLVHYVQTLHRYISSFMLRKEPETNRGCEMLVVAQS